jgi:two-component system, chemotaxis family, chemotaxis protein CheY
MKALIAEDDPSTRHLLREMLEGLASVDAAENGRIALERFEAARGEGDPYRLILIDIMMPEMNGQELLGEIRRIESEAGLSSEERSRAIMITMRDDKRNIVRAFRSQCDAYLVKPVNRAELLGQIRSLGLID